MPWARQLQPTRSVLKPQQPILRDRRFSATPARITGFPLAGRARSAPSLNPLVRLPEPRSRFAVRAANCLLRRVRRMGREWGQPRTGRGARRHAVHGARRGERQAAIFATQLCKICAARRLPTRRGQPISWLHGAARRYSASVKEVRHALTECFMPPVLLNATHLPRLRAAGTRAGAQAGAPGRHAVATRWKARHLCRSGTRVLPCHPGRDGLHSNQRRRGGVAPQPNGSTP